MNKVLFSVIKEVAFHECMRGTRIQAQEIKEDIYCALKKRGFRRKDIPLKDVLQAINIIMKRASNAKSNMVVYHTTENYYAKVTCKYYKVTR